MTVPKRWRRYVELAAAAGDSQAVALMVAHRTSRLRVASRSRTRRAAEDGARTARRDRMAEIRAIVQARAGNSCELCGCIGTEAHHVISGPSRRVKEAPDTIVLLCAACHRSIHRNDRGTLSMLSTLEHLSPEAREAVRRRLERVA